MLTNNFFDIPEDVKQQNNSAPQNDTLYNQMIADETFASSIPEAYRKKLAKEYSEWEETHDVGEPITDEFIKDALIKDLQFVSKMDVSEYTLYRKWDEINGKKWQATVQENTTFFEAPKTHDYPILHQIKSNIWYPQSIDDYKNLQPRVISAQNDATLTQTWNILRTFTHTQVNNSNIGRNLYFIVEDAPTKKYLGVIAVSSDFMDLTPRDNYIGWSRELKTSGRMINHTAIGSTICPTQPLGFNYVGGKLIALLTLSDVIEKVWTDTYGDVLAGMTTTSLYDSFSQYQNLSYWTKRGHSSGSIKFEPRRETLELVKKYLSQKYSRKYWEWYLGTEPQGMPLKRDFKQRSLAFLYGKLEIEKSLFETDHKRGIYFSPFYTNTNEFLRKEITADKLVRRYKNDTESLVNIWKDKYAKKRIEALQEQGRLKLNESLFYDELVWMPWEETKEKYLKGVGKNPTKETE